MIWEKNRKKMWLKTVRQGITIGKAEAILELLADAGTFPQTLQEKLLRETDLDTLKKWLKLAAKAESIEEFREKAGV